MFELLHQYRDRQLESIWLTRKNSLIESNQKLSMSRAGDIIAAQIASEALKELQVLDEIVDRSKGMGLTDEIVDLYDWLYMYDNQNILADVQNFSGTRTLLADMPTEEYTPLGVQI